MSSFKFLHAADLHLDSPLRGLARRGEIAEVFVSASRRALDNLVSAAIEEQVAFLVIAGDVYDGNWKDYATGHAFVRQMGRLARAEIPVFLIRGNHDAESVVTRSLTLPSNVHALSVRSVETVTIEALRVAIHGRGFADRSVRDNVALTYPAATPGYFNIGVLHTSLNGRDGHDVYAPCSPEDLAAKGYDYWALGHVHHREVVGTFPHIVFPGNLQGRHARETGAKGASLVHVADGRVSALEPLVLDAVRFDHRTLDLSSCADRAAFEAALRDTIAAARNDADGRPLALRLTLGGRTALHAALAGAPEQLAEDVQAVAAEIGADILIERLKDQTEPPGGREPMPLVDGFEDMLAAVAGDPEVAEAIAGVLGELWNKMPAEAQALLPGDGERDAFTRAAIEEAHRAVLAGFARTDDRADDRTEAAVRGDAPSGEGMP